MRQIIIYPGFSFAKQGDYPLMFTLRMSSEVELGNIKVVTFDAGGTLIHPHPSASAVYAEVLAQHRITIQPPALEHLFSTALQKAQSTVREDINEKTEKEFWRGIVRDTIGRYCPQKEKFGDVFEDIFDAFASASRWKAAEDASETLSSLKSRGYRLALLSNADKRYRQVFAEMGLEKLLEHLFISSEIGYEKPDGRIFTHVQKLMQVPAESILHVGDSPWRDGKGAADAGWQYLILGSKPESADGHSYISSLSRLLNLLPDMNNND